MTLMMIPDRMPTSRPTSKLTKNVKPHGIMSISIYNTVLSVNLPLLECKSDEVSPYFCSSTCLTRYESRPWRWLRKRWRRLSWRRGWSKSTGWGTGARGWQDFLHMYKSVLHCIYTYVYVCAQKWPKCTRKRLIVDIFLESAFLCMLFC